MQEHIFWWVAGAQAAISIVCWFVAIEVRDKLNKAPKLEGFLNDVVLDGFMSQGGIIGFFMGFLMIAIVFVALAILGGEIVLIFECLSLALTPSLQRLRRSLASQVRT